MSRIQSVRAFVKKHQKLSIISLTVVIVASVTGVIVHAAIPTNSSGVISACVSTDILTQGQVRVIDSSSRACNSNESSLAWNSATTGQYVKNLKGSNFSSADLRYHDFSKANLSGGIFDNTEVSGADFTNANLSHSTINGLRTDYSGGQRLTKFKSADFSKAHLQGTINNINLANSNFTAVTLDGVNMSNNNLSGIDFRTTVILTSFSIVSSKLQNVNFSGMTLNNTQLISSDVTGSDFSNVQFVDSDLNTTDFAVANVTGVTWSNTTCPDATNSDSNGNTCIGHLIP